MGFKMQDTNEEKSKSGKKGLKRVRIALVYM